MTTSGCRLGEPLLHPLLAGAQRVDVPGGEPHVSSRLRARSPATWRGRRLPGRRLLRRGLLRRRLLGRRLSSLAPSWPSRLGRRRLLGRSLPRSRRLLGRGRRWPAPSWRGAFFAGGVLAGAVLAGAVLAGAVLTGAVVDRLGRRRSDRGRCLLRRSFGRRLLGRCRFAGAFLAGAFFAAALPAGAFRGCFAATCPSAATAVASVGVVGAPRTSSPMPASGGRLLSRRVGQRHVGRCRQPRRGELRFRQRRVRSARRACVDRRRRGLPPPAAPAGPGLFDRFGGERIGVDRRVRRHVGHRAIDAAAGGREADHHDGDGLADLHHLAGARRRRIGHEAQRDVATHAVGPDRDVRAVRRIRVDDAVHARADRMVLHELEERHQLVDHLAGTRCRRRRDGRRWRAVGRRARR